MKASKRMKKLSRKIHKLADKLADKLHLGDGARNRMHKTICTVTDHPVDVANGRISTEQTDFEIAGPLPLVSPFCVDLQASPESVKIKPRSHAAAR